MSGHETFQEAIDAHLAALRQLESFLCASVAEEASDIEEPAGDTAWMAEALGESDESEAPFEDAEPLTATTCLTTDGLYDADAAAPRKERVRRYWRSFGSEGQPAVGAGGRYVVGSELARGGMGRVFRAFDTLLERPIALKIVPPPASDAVRRSLPVANALEHRSIVGIEEVGELDDGALYLVMPFLEGATLQRLLPADDFARDALLLAFRRACEGVAYAHRRGAVHRDLKPGNILIEPDGNAVVLDWGLACRAGSRPPGETGLVGTPLYMAPEQYAGGPLLPQTDVFALGTVLYELLTGRHPAGPGEDFERIAYRIRNETPPPPSVLREGISSALDAIALRCLAKDPAQRFADAGELLEALDDA